jgi:hypothetical protein
MKLLFISIAIWILIVPSLVASFLILTALAAFVPQLYLALAWFGVAFSAAAVLCGPFWLPSRSQHPLPPRSPVAGLRSTNLFQGGKQ